MRGDSVMAGCWHNPEARAAALRDGWLWTGDVGCFDAEWGEIVVAFVVPQPGATPDADALDASCLQPIARFKRPKRCGFVAALPKNRCGQVPKTVLRERLRG